MQDRNLSIEKRIKELNDITQVCKTVEATINTDGWKNIIEPLIDKMIGDIVGRKTQSGRWDCGSINRARKDEKREFYIGYKQSLIDLHNRIYAYKDAIKRYEDERGKLVSGTSQRFTVPLVDDTRYGVGDDGAI